MSKTQYPNAKKVQSRQGRDFPPGTFNPYVDMAVFLDDLTPNNINTGAVQVPRVRIDHFYDSVGKETNPKITRVK